jgi:imidazole glycerol phosphate synthase glutamine amidotransferase subunit
MTRVLVIKTGIANLASIAAGFKRAGADVWYSEKPDDVERADYVVLPGVGAFAAGMEYLNGRGLVEPLRKRFADNKPTFAVCLGLQLLCRESEEDPGVEGLGIIDQKVKRFPDIVRVPQLGWNNVTPGDGCKVLTEGYAYFANSFRLTEPPADWNAATADYAGFFVAGMEKGPFLACQFHPELSGPWGLGVIKGWLGKNGKGGG